MNFLIYGGYDTRNDHVYISGGGTYIAPVRRVTTFSVPGRDGDLVQDEGSFDNVDVTYPCFIVDDFPRNFASFKAAMLSKTGYQRLEDTYHPEHFRKGFLSAGIAPEAGTLNRTGRFELVFHCKPQRWLKSGEDVIGFESAGSVQNPTMYAALPLIRAYGTGTFYIGAYGVQITEADEFTDIDCEVQDAFKGAVNKNPYIRLLNGSFPKIEPGNIGITMTGITRLEITPRWWTI